MKYIFTLLSFLYGASAFAQIDRIDHFYVSSPKSEVLFNFFKINFQLPVAWDYQTFGDFSTGALSLGNAAIEFVKFKDTGKTEFSGIALQPHESAEKIVTILDSIKVLHDSIEPFVFNMDNGAKDTGWETVTVKNILPDNVNLFVCDYKHRDEVYKQIKKTSDSLAILHGGKLGITNIETIVIGCKDLSLSSNKLSKLPGLTRKKNNLFKLDSGASIQLTNSDNPGIVRIVIKVNSIDNAKIYLQSKGILGEVTKDSVFINPQAIDGLKVELVDK